MVPIIRIKIIFPRVIKLTVLTVQGWIPLCHFLNVTVIPEEPFPKMNEAEVFNKIVISGKLKTWKKLIFGGGIWVLFMSALAYCVVPRRIKMLT